MGAHDQFADQVELYALGALTAQERRDFEAHLAVCANCATIVRDLTVVVAGLTAGMEAEPSASVRTALMARIHPSRPTYIDRWMPLAAALVLAVGLGAYAVQLRGRMTLLESQLRDATLRADANERQMADLRRAAFDAESTVAVLTAPDLARVDLAGQPAAPDATARAFWSRSRGLVFTASSLPAAPAGRTYQLWVLTARPAPTSAGLLKPDSNGRVSAVFATPSDLPNPVAMAVTLEPEGGVLSPTGDKFLVGLAQ